MQHIQTLDYAAIVIYMALMAGIGIFLGYLVKDIGDYFKGGSAISWVAGGISNFMSMFSTFIFVAYASIAYEHGLVALTILWSSVPPALIAAAIFAKRWRRAGIITPVEFLETRFNAPVRQIFSWGGVAFKILDNMVRLYAIGIFVAAATPLSMETAIIACGLIVVLYTVIGGLWAVIVTDVVQFVILVVATLILIPLALEAAGGWEKLTSTIPQHFTPFNGPKGAPLFLLAYYVMILIKYNGNWAFIQRFYSVKDEKAGQKLGLLTAALFFVFPAIFLFPSIAARVVLPDLANAEMAYVSICLQLLPEGIMGLMIAAMLAATMSTLSAEYNVTAGVLTRDIYQRLLNPVATPRQALWTGRWMTFAVGGLVTVGALYVGGFGGAFEANKLFTGLFAIPTVVPLVLGILLRRPQPWGALATVATGVSLGLFLNAHPEVSWEAATLIEIGACVAVFLASGLVPSRDAAYRSRVDAFFRKLATPVRQSAITKEKAGFQRAMTRLYAVAMGTTGALFVGMCLPSVGQLSGNLALLAGIVCLALAAGMFRISNRQTFTKPETNEIPEKIRT